MIGTLKKIGLWIAGILLALLLLASGIIFLKKDDIIHSYSEDLNKNLRGSFSYEHVGISIFSTFPQIGLSVTHPNVVSNVLHRQDTLFRAESITLSFSLWEVLSGSEKSIREVILDRPKARIALSPSGKANYDIWKSTSETPSEADTADAGSPGIFRIDYCSIKDGQLMYRDSSLAIDMDLIGLNFETSGTLGSKQYDFEVFTDISKASLTYENIRYLNEANIDWTGDWTYLLDSNALHFTDHEILLNALKLKADGSIAFLSDRYNINVKVNTPGEDIRQILSLIPAVYTPGMEQLSTEGTLAISSIVQGEYGPGPDDYPSFKLQGNISDGTVKYEGASSDISAIHAELNIEKPQGNLNQTSIRLPTFSLQVDQYPLKGSLFASHLTDNPNIRGSFNTNLDLAALKQSLPAEQFKRLSGRLSADITFDLKYNQIEEKAYDKISFNGRMNTEQLDLLIEPYPAISTNQAKIDLAPERLSLQMDQFRYGQSDVSGTLEISDPLFYYIDDQAVTITGDLRGSRWLVDEWMTTTDSDTIHGDTARDTESNQTEIIPIEAELRLDLDRLDYTSYQFENLKIHAIYSGDRLDLRRASTKWQGSPITASGNVQHVQAYTYGTKPLSGQLSVAMERLDLDQFYQSEDMNEESEEPDQQETASSAAYVLPDDVDIQFDFTSDAFKYGDITGRNLSADMQMSNQVLEISKASMDGMGGAVNIAGVYNTQNAQRPTFDFKYDLSNLEISSLFGAVETLGLFVPIGKRMIGRLNSSMVISGALDEQLSPVYDQMDASGHLATLNAALPQLSFLNKIDERLGFNAINASNLKDLKTWFTVEDGRMTVEKFPFRAGDIQMSMNGSQYLDKSMDYTINAQIPKELLTSTQIGQEAEKGLDWLQQQSQKAGIDMKEVEEIELDIHLTGALDQPKFSVSFAGSTQKTVQDRVTSAVDTVKSKVKDKMDTVKQEVRNQAKETFDTAKKKLKDQAKNIIEEQVKGGDDTSTQKTVDDIKKEAEQNVDSVKNKLKKWNPFNKNKK